MSGAVVSYAEIMAAYDKAFDLAEVKPEPVPEADAPAITITDKHLRLLEDHLTVDVLPDEALLSHEARMDAAEAGMWLWLVNWVKEYHASEGEWPIFSKHDKAMLKLLANREFCEPRFLHLPAEIRQTLVHLVIDAFFAYLDSSGDEATLRRRVRHSHHLVNVRLIVPEDPDDLFDPLAVFVGLPKFPGVVRCRATHANLTGYLYSGLQRFKGWHLWRNPSEVWKLTPSFHRLRKPLKLKSPPKPTRYEAMPYDPQQVLHAVGDIFEASGDTALPASAIMPVLAGRCIALNHPRELARYLGFFGVKTQQTWHKSVGRNVKCYRSGDVYNAFEGA